MRLLIGQWRIDDLGGLGNCCRSASEEATAADRHEDVVAVDRAEDRRGELPLLGSERNTCGDLPRGCPVARQLKPSLMQDMPRRPVAGNDSSTSRPSGVSISTFGATRTGPAGFAVPVFSMKTTMRHHRHPGLSAANQHRHGPLHEHALNADLPAALPVTPLSSCGMIETAATTE
ncbi:MAG: hypothetical protein U1E76_02625 [Planctomycetota bacterium]